MPQFNDPTVELTYLEKDDVLMSGSPVDFANIKAQNVFNRSLTRSALQTLISASELIIGQKYTITNAVTSTLVLVVEAVAVNKLNEIAVNASNGDNVSYDITTDIATAIQQTQINGNGFVKASGTTLSYDNSTYLTTIEGIAAGGELEGNYASPTLKNSSVVGKVLTGLSVTGSAVVSTDSILTGIGKLQNQVNGLAGGVEYQGTWNASTNTPTLTSSVGTQGFYYVVSVAGSTNLNGITTWELGDWAIFNGSTWQKVDNTDAVVSVNGYTGIVTLSASDIGAVPYTGATTNVDLGTHSLTASDLVINHASGSGVAASITKGGAGEALTVVKSSGSGNAASITGGTTLISTLSVTGDSVITGNLTVDSGTLFVDATNNRVAIGSYAGGAGALPTNNKLWLQGAGGSGTASQNRIDLGFNDNPGFSSFIGVENPDFSNTTLVLGTQASGVSTSALWIRNGNVQIGSRTPTVGAEKLQVTGSASISSTLAVTGAVTGSSTAQFTKLGLGASPSSTANILISSNITGAVTAYGVLHQGTIQSGVTTTGYGFQNIFNTQAASFNLTDYIHYSAISGTIGAGSTVTNQYGYLVESNLTGATNNYGFYGKIPSATGRWNLYMTGTAANYLAGNTLIGSATAVTGAKLEVTGTASISGALSIGNTVASAAAVASTHKVTVVIGGVTYYLLATNV